MKRLHQFFVAITVVSVTSLAAAAEEMQPVRHILSSKGDQLYDGDQPFRFISFNIPNLHLIEDSFSFSDPNPWRWPNEFELVDALESVRQMGGTVVRTYVLSVHRDGSDMGSHVHVRAPGDFNEEAFRVLDKVLQIAGERGIRVIIPLVDNWKWWGGHAEYAKFRGKPPEAFWSDEQVIADFEETIRYTLSRVNSFTGIAYKDDPAIFGWETGNELDSPPEWTSRIAAHIKRLDPNHLVIDGYSLHGVRQESLDDPNIDVITTHHYPNTDSGFVEPILKARAMTKGKKPYFVGEFGFVPAQEIKEVLNTVIDEGIVGALLWSLRFHNREGGFYWHDEPSGENLFKAYHWPGFNSGEGYEETSVLDLVRRSAYRIRDMKLPTPSAPAAPSLLPIEHPSRISWQGSAGAKCYDVERSNNESGPWEKVGQDISDAALQYRPLFSDSSVEKGCHYYYRVIAKNNRGSSDPSNVIGPVVVNHMLLVDEMQDESILHSTAGAVKQRADHPRQVQEDIHRKELGPGGQVVYQNLEPASGIRVFLFCNSSSPACEIAVSSDGHSFEQVRTKQVVSERDAGNYGYLQPVLVEATIDAKDRSYLRIRNTSSSDAEENAFQISRVEIAYDDEKN
ncbi:cellulase family glycosylhydrolase [Bythopirellula polymerisocia]|uniref:mannan endo-1,4-beta-mannosidase n=1 Tax=Bythopirellula polymerisocia TaxID=2528003 RepID=A0A5C6CW95_9BACT|nr:cellulase family glycosylhydrolase [Bythopirellula polymerisocia]TWU29253.1 hypothetical protein Pla144_00290 [Bythopirellula polymerisocia]